MHLWESCSYDLVFYGAFSNVAIITIIITIIITYIWVYGQREVTIYF